MVRGVEWAYDDDMASQRSVSRLPCSVRVLVVPEAVTRVDGQRRAGTLRNVEEPVSIKDESKRPSNRLGAGRGYVKVVHSVAVAGTSLSRRYRPFKTTSGTRKPPTPSDVRDTIRDERSQPTEGCGHHPRARKETTADLGGGTEAHLGARHDDLGRVRS